MIKVSSELRIYEIDGKDIPGPVDKPMITVNSHWNRDAFVVLEIDGKRYTVVAADLTAAIENATNVARF